MGGQTGEGIGSPNLPFFSLGQGKVRVRKFSEDMGIVSLPREMETKAPGGDVGRRMREEG